MGEMTGRWIAWARGLRRRWTCRRVSRVSLRSRLAAARSRCARRSAAVGAAPAQPAAVDRSRAIACICASTIRAVARSRRHRPRASRVHDDDRAIVGRAPRRDCAGLARPASRAGVGTSEGRPLQQIDFDNRPDSLRPLGHAVAPPLTLPASRRIDARGQSVLASLRGLFDAPVTRARTRMPADASRFAPRSDDVRAHAYRAARAAPPPMRWQDAVADRREQCHAGTTGCARLPFAARVGDGRAQRPDARAPARLQPPCHQASSPR